MTDQAEGREKAKEAVPKARALTARVFIITKSTLAVADPRHIRWGIVTVWLAFAAALFSSNFFIIAQTTGVFAAIEIGAIIGPMKTVTVVPCETSHYYGPCGVYDEVPKWTISLKILFMLAAIASAGLWFWASERARKNVA